MRPSGVFMGAVYAFLLVGMPFIIGGSESQHHGRISLLAAFALMWGIVVGSHVLVAALFAFFAWLDRADRRYDERKQR